MSLLTMKDIYKVLKMNQEHLDLDNEVYKGKDLYPISVAQIYREAKPKDFGYDSVIVLKLVSTKNALLSIHIGSRVSESKFTLSLFNKDSILYTLKVEYPDLIQQLKHFMKIASYYLVSIDDEASKLTYSISSIFNTKENELFNVSSTMFKEHNIEVNHLYYNPLLGYLEILLDYERNFEDEKQIGIIISDHTYGNLKLAVYEMYYEDKFRVNEAYTELIMNHVGTYYEHKDITLLPKYINRILTELKESKELKEKKPALKERLFKF